jgi:predicted transcriptional regulator
MTRDNNETETFGDMLRILRLNSNMTQETLGRLTGYCTTAIARLESGARRPNITVVSTQFVKALQLEGQPEVAGKFIALARISRAHS